MMSQDHPRKEKEDEMQLAEEARLIQRAMEGDTDAFAMLYEACLEPVYRYIYRRLENVFDAENLTSEAFTRAIDMLAQGRYDWKGKPFKAWLIGIATNIIQERYRTLKSTPVMEDLNDILGHNEPLSGEENVLNTTVQQEEHTALWQLVEELPTLEQSVVVLRHVYELSYAQIAKRLGRTEDACKQLHYRALKKLRLIAQEAGLWSESGRGKNEHKYSLPAQALADELNTQPSIKEYKEHSPHNEEQENSVFATLTACLVDSYVEKALEVLPWLERSCLLLYADAQFSEAEIAEILNLDEEAVCGYLQTGSQHWLHTYSSLLEEELGIPLSAAAVSSREDFSRVKRLIGCSHRYDISTQHFNGIIGSTVN